MWYELFFVHLGCFLCSVEGVSVFSCIFLVAILVPFHNMLPFLVIKEKKCILGVGH